MDRIEVFCRVGISVLAEVQVPSSRARQAKIGGPGRTRTSNQIAISVQIDSGNQTADLDTVGKRAPYHQLV